MDKKNIALVSSLLAFLILALIIIFRHELSSLPSNSLVLLFIAALFSLYFFYRVIFFLINLRWVRRILYPEKYIDGTWVGFVSRGGELKHYQVEEIRQQNEGEYVISGACFSIDKKDEQLSIITQTSEYAPQAKAYTQQDDGSFKILFPYYWNQDHSTEGVCKRDIIASSHTPNEQNGYFFDERGGGRYFTYLRRVPDHIVKKYSGDQKKMLAWFLEEIKKEAANIPPQENLNIEKNSPTGEKDERDINSNEPANGDYISKKEKKLLRIIEDQNQKITNIELILEKYRIDMESPHKDAILVLKDKIIYLTRRKSEMADSSSKFAIIKEIEVAERELEELRNKKL